MRESDFDLEVGDSIKVKEELDSTKVGRDQRFAHSPEAK
jgi:hypothetical protein